ncbi:type VI secretion system baseplate subunit TssE [bacterium]|nr:type VI secretion system baseplate subunit TssE [bacterium]
MAELEQIDGAIAPLFDRLRASRSPMEAQSLAVYDAKEMADSVAKELENLLNTRSPTSIQLYQARNLSVIDYGIPELVDFNPDDGGDRGRLQAILQKAISAFEPRLQNIQLSLAPVLGKPRKLLLKLAAVLVTASIYKPVDFIISLSPTEGKSEVQQPEALPDETSRKAA